MGSTLLLPIVLTLGAVAPAQAALIFSMQQVGADVVATGSGSANTSALSIYFTGNSWANVQGVAGRLELGPTVNTDFWRYTSPTATFGSGASFAANSYSGSHFGFSGSGRWLMLPVGYVSGSALSGSATFLGQTFTSLGLTTGTYTWTWGSGASADSATLYLGTTPPGVPEPASLALLATGLAVMGRARRRRRA